MERILCSKKGIEIGNDSNQIILLPVRHHSPACAYHIKNMIKKYKPDAVFVEGPDNANEYLDIMLDDNTKPPFAIYYSYHDVTARIDKEKGHYKCYYPFLDYSPEFVAFAEGKKNGAEISFVDMPYGDILVASEQGKGLLKDVEKNTYNDDYLISENSYSLALVQKAGFRSFDEFWEKYFEVNGLSMDSEEWFNSLLFYCNATRENTTQESLYEEGCIAREKYMSNKVYEYINSLADNDKKTIFVVTGGFHTKAIKDNICQYISEKHDGSNELLKPVPAKDQSVYIMPYSMDAAASLNGYASGMPFPEFYHNIWKNVNKGIDKPYDTTVLDFLVKTGKSIRKKDGGLSAYDEICAYQMMGGLSALRGKNEPGAYELRDAILSTFVKGEYNIATDAPLRELEKILIGDRLGKVCENAAVPSIIKDFQNQCEKFGLKNTSVNKKEVVLSIFSTPKHRQISMFFNRLIFLNTGYAKKIKGPNLKNRTDRNLIREIWEYKWSAGVNATLIDVSVHGATIEDAILSIIKERLSKGMQAGQCARLITEIYEMGLESHVDELYNNMFDIIQSDTDFYSLADALKYLKMMNEMKSLYDSQLDMEVLINVSARKLIMLMPDMTTVKDENLVECMEALKLLYQITDASAEYIDALMKMKTDLNINAGLNGCINGILYGSGTISEEDIMHVCTGYLTGTKDQLMQASVFFRGLFFSAKDLLFSNDVLITLMDTFFTEVDAEEFMELLPEFRMAFAYFTPSEIDRIAQMAAKFHGVKSDSILLKDAVSPALIEYGKELDKYIATQV